MVERARLLLRRGDPGGPEAVAALREVPGRLPGQSQVLLPVAQIQAEAALGGGEPSDALRLLMDALRRVTTAHPASAWGFAHAMARALVATARGGGDPDLVVEGRAMLSQAREHFPRSAVQPVWDAVLDAELAPLDGGPPPVAAPWTDAATLVADPSFEGPALLRAYVRYRAARERVEAGDRDGATALLQASLEECHRMGAAPLEAAAADLARRARLALSGGADASAAGDVVQRLGLTAREQEVLRLVAEGRSNAQIATELFISPKTASVHVSNILAKLDVASRGEAAAKAHEVGLLA
jgi:DNA-binding CsgD family transcriptional regulator